MAPKKTDSAPKAKPTHASYQDMIIDAIVNLKDRTGSSRQSLKKYVKANNQITASSTMFDSLFNRALKAGVEKGIFEQPKGPSGTTKLSKKSKDAAKPAVTKEGADDKEPKKAAPKKETVKKATTTKKAAAPKKEGGEKKAAPKKTATAKKEAGEKKAAPKKTAAKKDTTAAEKPAALSKTKTGRVSKAAAKPAAKKAAAPKKAAPKKEKAPKKEAKAEAAE